MNDIIWVIRRKSLSIASVRYRTILPALGIESSNFRNIFVYKNYPRIKKSTTAVIFCKTFTPENIKFAKEAHSKGVKVFIELCDNIFLSHYTKESSALDPQEGFFEMLPYTSAIIVTANELKNTITANLPTQYKDLPFFISPDGIETEEILQREKRLFHQGHYLNFSNKITKTIKQLIRLLKKIVKFFIRQKLRINQEREDLINQLISDKGNKRYLCWYGNAGSSDGLFGMKDLVNINSTLKEIAIKFDTKLIVISNNKNLYNKIKDQFGIESEFLEWELSIMFRVFQFVDVVLIPNQLNHFSKGKSPNRTLFALEHGLPVVADITPALEPYQRYIFCGNWTQNISEIFTNPAAAQKKIEEFNREAKDALNPETIGKNLLNFIKSTPFRKNHFKNGVCFFIQFVQDSIFFEPLVEKLISSNYSFKIYILKSAIQKNPELTNFVLKYRTQSVVIKDELLDNHDFPFFYNISTVLTASESSLSPHRKAHLFVKLAQSHGIKCYTFQHGIENIGLTYSDEKQKASEISFASDKVFIWGKTEDLLENLHPSTKTKCISLGIINSTHKTISSQKNIIAIFENLHWTRYSTNYRDVFIQFIKDLALNYPNYQIKIKPHPAGKWAKIIGEEVKKFPNLFIIDSQGSSKELIAQARVVLSTPSTVILDSILHGRPTGLLSLNEQYPKYKDLPQVNTWKDVEKLLYQKSNDESAGIDNSFLKSIAVRTDAADHFMSNYL